MNFGRMNIRECRIWAILMSLSLRNNGVLSGFLYHLKAFYFFLNSRYIKCNVNVFLSKSNYLTEAQDPKISPRIRWNAISVPQLSRGKISESVRSQRDYNPAMALLKNRIVARQVPIATEFN